MIKNLFNKTLALNLLVKWLLPVIGLLFYNSNNAIASENPNIASNNINKTILLPANFSINNNIDFFTAIPPTFKLRPLQNNSRTGLIWLGQTTNGLIIAGQVFGEPPQWPQAASAMANHDYIELWLTSTDNVVLPPIGWINQFGNETLQNAQDCQRFANVSNGDFVKILATSSL